ncbi:hypothetical protein CK203_076409 [Vitis vinifera]|uniref:Uncharacterized protein n=1 Tax=Vitis vinifera TaxID=29760 RepID=A0A438C0M5_VITVI|nr:hypothetical protein CK203_076409 [Vitis vinifera]
MLKVDVNLILELLNVSSLVIHQQRIDTFELENEDERNGNIIAMPLQVYLRRLTNLIPMQTQESKTVIVSRVINSGKLSGDRVSFRSPSPSPNTFRSVGSSSENTHRRQTFPANFPATSFSDTDHTRRNAWKRSPTFVKAPEPKDHPRASHAQFFVRLLHLMRRRLRAREDFPGHAPPPPASLDTDYPSFILGSAIRALHVPFLGFFASVDPPNSFSGELQLLFLHPNPCTCLRKCSSTFPVVPCRDLKLSPFPVVPRRDLQPDNYLSWSASIELWFMGQGYEDHLITQEADIPEAKGLYTNDIQRLYKVASAIVHIIQQDLDLSTYIGQIASLKEEFLTVMPLTPNVGAQQTQLDKFFMVLTLIGLRPDLEPVRDQILGSSSVLSLDDMFARLLPLEEAAVVPEVEVLIAPIAINLATLAIVAISYMDDLLALPMWPSPLILRCLSLRALPHLRLLLPLLPSPVMPLPALPTHLLLDPGF